MRRAAIALLVWVWAVAFAACVQTSFASPLPLPCGPLGCGRCSGALFGGEDPALLCDAPAGLQNGVPSRWLYQTWAACLAWGDCGPVCVKAFTPGLPPWEGLDVAAIDPPCDACARSTLDGCGFVTQLCADDGS